MLRTEVPSVGPCSIAGFFHNPRHRGYPPVVMVGGRCVRPQIHRRTTGGAPMNPDLNLKLKMNAPKPIARPNSVFETSDNLPSKGTRSSALREPPASLASTGWRKIGRAHV